jgi:hypothetical protein
VIPSSRTKARRTTSALPKPAKRALAVAGTAVQLALDL